MTISHFPFEVMFQSSQYLKLDFDNCTGLYCNEAFKKAVEQNGLRGVKFVPGLLPTIED